MTRANACIPIRSRFHGHMTKSAAVLTFLSYSVYFCSGSLNVAYSAERRRLNTRAFSGSLISRMREKQKKRCLREHKRGNHTHSHKDMSTRTVYVHYLLFIHHTHCTNYINFGTCAFPIAPALLERGRAGHRKPALKAPAKAFSY